MTYSDGQYPSPATTPSWELGRMIMIMEVNQVRLMCTCVAAQLGHSRQNYSPPMERPVIILEFQSLFQATSSSWELGPVM